MIENPPQRLFAAALMDPLRPPPPGLTTWNGSDVAQRFAVYRNNVAVSLMAALRVKFPVVRALVGDATFDAAALTFVRTTMPGSRILARYGEDFPDFLERFGPAASLPWLADVARLEAARIRAYHAADMAVMKADDLEAMPAATLEALRIHLHPGATFMSSSFAIVSLWAAHQGHVDAGAVDPHAPEDALVARPTLDVEVIRLGPGVLAFLGHMLEGETLAQAAATAFSADPGFDLPAAIRAMLAAGVAAEPS
jgi:hypothetical protein